MDLGITTAPAQIPSLEGCLPAHPTSSGLVVSHGWTLVSCRRSPWSGRGRSPPLDPARCPVTPSPRRGPGPDVHVGLKRHRAWSHRHRHFMSGTQRKGWIFWSYSECPPGSLKTYLRVRLGSVVPPESGKGNRMLEFGVRNTGVGVGSLRTLRVKSVFLLVPTGGSEARQSQSSVSSPGVSCENPVNVVKASGLCEGEGKSGDLRTPGLVSGGFRPSSSSGSRL